ncbi:MAG TPA: glycine zipper 2TM domain-containing protein [Albitalea sp.]
MKTSIRSFGVAGAMVLAALAAGCASRPAQTVYQPAYQPVYRPVPGSDAHAQYGVVHSIDTIRAQNRVSGGGAIVGGVVGAVVGRQIGSGSGRDAGTAVGAVAGAIIGNEIEKNQRQQRDIYRVTVRVDRGGLRSFDYAQLDDLRVGDRVRIENNQLYRW